MPSPFPGMDPYLEAHWLDVHGSLVHLAKSALQPQLGDDLVARTEERLIVEDPFGLSRRAIGPDVRVVELPRPRSTSESASGVAVAEPYVFKTEAEPFSQRSIEIIDLTTGGRVITVIEFLSPSNKFPGDGRTKYLQKQQECRDAGVNVVEIDLTRSGTRELLVFRWATARQYDKTYAVSIWRASQASNCSLFPIRLQDRFPIIPVPLRVQEPDAVLDLKSLIDGVYASSRYDRTTDYTRPPDPPLEGDDSIWADSLLRAAGKR